MIFLDKLIASLMAGAMAWMALSVDGLASPIYFVAASGFYGAAKLTDLYITVNKESE
jgi:hypothetical protein